MLLYKCYCPNCVIRSAAALACCLKKTGAWSNNLCFFALLLSRHSFGLLPGAAASQHPLVPDQRHVVGRGALSSLSVAPAGLRALSPLHEPRGRRARLPHPPQARRVWHLHDKHTGWVFVCVFYGSSADFLIVYHLSLRGLFTLWVDFFYCIDYQWFTREVFCLEVWYWFVSGPMQAVIQDVRWSVIDAA